VNTIVLYFGAPTHQAKEKEKNKQKKNKTKTQGQRTGGVLDWASRERFNTKACPQIMESSKNSQDKFEYRESAA